MNNLVIFDVDGTLFKGQTQNLFLNILKKEKICSSFDFLKISLWFFAYKLKILKDTKKIRNYAYSKLYNMSIKQIDDIIDKYFFLFKKRIYNDSYSIINYHKKLNDSLLLISASIEPIIKKISNDFGISEYICTKLKTKGSTFTGEIIEPAVYGKNKLSYINEYLKKTNESFDDIFYYGDHISDISVFNFVKTPICANPSRKLNKIAKSNNWKIINLK